MSASPLSARDALCRVLAVASLVLVVLAGAPAYATKRPLQGVAIAESGGTNPTQPNPFANGPIPAYLTTRIDRVTAAVTDLTTGNTFIYNPGVSEQTASIMKVDILETLLYEAQLAHRSLGATEQKTAAAMIEQSDNTAAQNLWNDAGGSTEVSAFDRRAGLTGTIPNQPGYWGESTTTALDQIALLRQIVVPTTLLDGASVNYLLGLMEHVVTDERFGVSSGVPPSAIVALKNGWVPIVGGDWQINTLGYVHGGGRDYLLAVLTTGNPYESYGIDTVNEIGEQVWSQLGTSDAAALVDAGRPTVSLHVRPRRLSDTGVWCGSSSPVATRRDACSEQHLA